MIIDILSGGIRGGTSLLFAGLGETISERAGVINLGTEGSMLVGALGGYAATYHTGSPWLGILGGAAAGALLALVHAVLVISRGANQYASGLTLFFLSLGLTALFGVDYVSRQITAFTPLKVPVLGDIPFIGPVLFDHDPLVYAGYVVVPIVAWIMFRTRAGLLLRSAGERADALGVNGYSVTAVRYVAVVSGGALAGIGGAHISIAYANSWFENMIAGRGFIAVSLVIFAMWHPVNVMLGAYLFGAALSLASVLQANGVDVNQFALNAIPFLMTLVVLSVLGKRTLRKAPDELLKVLETAKA